MLVFCFMLDSRIVGGDSPQVFVHLFQKVVGSRGKAPCGGEPPQDTSRGSKNEIDSPSHAAEDGCTNVKVFVHIFQKVAGVQRAAPLVVRRSGRNSCAFISAGWGKKTVRGTVFEGKPTRLEGVPLLMTSTYAIATSR